MVTCFICLFNMAFRCVQKIEKLNMKWININLKLNRYGNITIKILAASERSATLIVTGYQWSILHECLANSDFGLAGKFRIILGTGSISVSGSELIEWVTTCIEPRLTDCFAKFGIGRPTHAVDQILME